MVPFTEEILNGKFHFFFLIFNFFFIIHNDNPKNTNSAVIHKRNSISLRHYTFSQKSQQEKYINKNKKKNTHTHLKSTLKRKNKICRNALDPLT